ncbi:hypothetical protein [Marinomonas sp. THO17]|uniref:hypothetical protein n=1 Tax=Marinomonas sp. THO17 TaxID=3149048 RepID=UPI00336BB091
MQFENVKSTSLEPNSPLEKRVFSLMKKTISDNISLEGFRALIANSQQIEIIFCLEDNQEIGFMYCGTYQLNNKLIIIRSMLGMLTQYRKDSLKKAKLVLTKSMFSIKMKHLNKQVCLVSVIINPLVYAGLCSYWRQTYPSPNVSMTKKYQTILESCSDYFNWKMNKDYVVKIPFSIFIEEKDIQRINQHNPYMIYFFSRVFSTNWDEGIVTVTPVNLMNLFSLTFRSIKKGIQGLVGK